MSSVTLLIFLLCFPLHCTGFERIHILYIQLRRTWLLICFTTAISFHSSGPACVVQKLRVSISRDVIARLLIDLETRRFGINKFTLVAELKSSAKSGTTDRREEEHVPQFHGRIDEKFVEWEI